MLAGLALALRFVPYSDHNGHYNFGWTLVILAIGLVVAAASVYLVYVLEILKFRRLDAIRLRRLRPGASPAQIQLDVVKDFETGEFEAVTNTGDAQGGRVRRRGAPRGSAADQPAAGGSGSRRRRTAAWRRHSRRSPPRAASGSSQIAYHGSSQAVDTSSASVAQPAITRQSEPRSVRHMRQREHHAEARQIEVPPPGRRPRQPHQAGGLGRHAVGGHQLLLLAHRVEEAERVRAEPDQAQRPPAPPAPAPPPPAPSRARASDRGASTTNGSTTPAAIFTPTPATTATALPRSPAAARRRFGAGARPGCARPAARRPRLPGRAPAPRQRGHHERVVVGPAHGQLEQHGVQPHECHRPLPRRPSVRAA